MSVTTYWDGAACVDWVQGCSAEFVSMLEDTYTNEVLAEPLSADLNGDFMVDLDNIDFQSTWPLGMADHAPSSRESSPGSKPAKNTRSHSQSRRESRNVSPALSSLSSHQTTSSAQSSPFKGAGSPKKTSKRKPVHRKSSRARLRARQALCLTRTRVMTGQRNHSPSTRVMVTTTHYRHGRTAISTWYGSHAHSRAIILH